MNTKKIFEQKKDRLTARSLKSMISRKFAHKLKK